MVVHSCPAHRAHVIVLRYHETQGTGASSPNALVRQDSAGKNETPSSHGLNPTRASSSRTRGPSAPSRQPSTPAWRGAAAAQQDGGRQADGRRWPMARRQFLELLPAGVRAVIVQGPDPTRDGRCGAARCRKQPRADRTIGFSPPISVSILNAAAPLLFSRVWSASRLVPRATVKHTFLYQSKEYMLTLTCHMRRKMRRGTRCAIDARACRGGRQRGHHDPLHQQNRNNNEERGRGC